AVPDVTAQWSPPIPASMRSASVRKPSRMPVTHKAMANTRAVPTTANKNWRRRNWTLRSVTRHMSTRLRDDGSRRRPDVADAGAIEAREPHVAVGTGGDPERRSHRRTGRPVGGDLAVEGDAADAVIAGGEPQIAVGTGGDGTGLFEPGGRPVERVDSPVTGDAADAVAAGTGEPQVAIRARHDPPRERDVGTGGVEGGDLPVGSDAPDPAVEVGEPHVAVPPGGDRRRQLPPRRLGVDTAHT